MTDPRLLSFFPQRPEHEQHQPAAAQHLPTPALPGGAVSMERPHAEPGVGMCWRVPGAQAATPELPLEPQAGVEGGWVPEGVNCYSSCRGLSRDITIRLCCTC